MARRNARKVWCWILVGILCVMAGNMICRFCGDNLKSANQKLLSSLGEHCNGNPNGKHVGVTDCVCCVYCGDEARPQNGRLITKLGLQCKNSPTGGHCLQ